MNFEQLVKIAVKATKPWRPNCQGYFISDVFATFQKQNPGSISLEQFKKQLLKTDLELSRADLVEAMDPQTVELSCINIDTGYSTHSFHFIRL